jgi:hypothetical protein
VHDFLLTFGHWLQTRSFALAIAQSDWVFPFVQATHFVGLSLWVGTNVALDLSLLGVGNKHQVPARLSAALFVWNWVGFAIAITGGFLLFSSSASMYVTNVAFLTKLCVLIPLALVLHIFNQRKVQEWGLNPDPPSAAKLAGAMELLLWLCVVTAAVSIPYAA